MRQLLKTDFLLWAMTAFSLWAAYLTYDHFANSGFGIVFHALDLLDAMDEGQEIRALIPNIRAFFIVPFLKSVAIALVLGWIAHRLAVAQGIRLGRRPNPTLAADYDDKPKHR
jgi:hypothetical protein